jgi:hypothetical protein
MAQHRIVAGPYEVARQGHCCHATTAYNFAGLHLDGKVALRRHKGLTWTKLGLDEDLTPTHQARKLELWPLFKEPKVVGKRAFWHVAKLFVNDTQICPPSTI